MKRWGAGIVALVMAFPLGPLRVSGQNYSLR